MIIAHVFLSNTSLDIKIKVETESFLSNKRLPQGDSISRIFLNIDLEDNLWRAHCEFNLKKPEIEDSYIKTEKSSPPKEIVYADEHPRNTQEVNNMIETVNAVFRFRNLNVEYNVEIETLQHGGTSRK